MDQCSKGILIIYVSLSGLQGQDWLHGNLTFHGEVFFWVSGLCHCSTQGTPCLHFCSAVGGPPEQRKPAALFSLMLPHFDLLW